MSKAPAETPSADTDPASPVPPKPIGCSARLAGWKSASGTMVATCFHRLLAAIFLVAWLSLGQQVLVLIGSRGLLPLADFVAAAGTERPLSFLHFPTLLALVPHDGVMIAGIWLGVALSVLGVLGWRPRLCAAGQTFWYLGYVTACRSFLGFQWDSLLIECGLLASFLPPKRLAPFAHLMFRALLFKLYFESGLAKWQSPLHDWRDGSAMTFYYETAPLPTPLAWYAHHLPGAWHLFESYSTLSLELLVPFAIFGPRGARLFAASAFTLFQLINAATANYAFFCYLSAALHLFLLDDRDLVRAHAWARRWLASICPARTTDVLRAGWGGIRSWRARPGQHEVSWARNARAVPTALQRRAFTWLACLTWGGLSATEAWFHFGDPQPESATANLLVPVLEVTQTFRLVNAFHLFAAVTRERIEPIVETADTKGAWTEQDFVYKPGVATRPPPFVAPHQPRVDFLLWFYGLTYQHRQPTYVATLLGRLCEDPASIAPLFVRPLPPVPSSVRLSFWSYRFTSPRERRATGAWWRRRLLETTPSVACAQSPRQD